MLLHQESNHTIGEALPTVWSPLWRHERRIREEFWRGFWLAASAGLGIGAWAGWMAAHVFGACP